MNCLNCAEPMQFSRRRQLWVCVECGSETRIEEDAALPFRLHQLPSILAIPLKTYLTETHPVTRLWDACQTVELFLRLAVSIGIAQAKQEGILVGSLLKQLREHIADPTLREWRCMVEIIARELAGRPGLAPEVSRQMLQGLAPLLDKLSGGESAPENSFIEMRNRLAHSGGMTKKKARQLQTVWEPRFDEAMSRLDWLTELTLVTRRNGWFDALIGPDAAALPYSPSSPEAADSLAKTFVNEEDVVVLRGCETLSLWPMLMYGVPRHPDATAPPPQCPALQVYVRCDIRLQFNPLGSDEVCHSIGDERGLQTFRGLLRLDEKVAEERETAFAVQGFESRLRNDARAVVGRTKEVDELKRTVLENREGVIWLSGQAGIGKSYLLADVAVQLLQSAPPDMLVLPFRFRDGDARCTREAFQNFAIERLRARLTPACGEPPDRERIGPGDRSPMDQLRFWLAALDGRRALFVLDGLDEIHARDPKFAQEVPLELVFPGVLWLCAGRPQLDAIFRTPRAQAYRFSEQATAGVPPMNAAGIREMLMAKIGPLSTELLRNDKEQDGEVVNPFIDRVVKNAQGLPLYVAYLIGDILNGFYRSFDLGERLPPSLDKYHEEMLRRLAVGTLHQVLTPLAATLAVAKEPLPIGALAETLNSRGFIGEEDDPIALTQNAVMAVISMLQLVMTQEGAEAYTLHHPSLREHMAKSRETRGALTKARESLWQLACGWKTCGSALRSYFIRHGVRHLIEAERWPEAAQLLSDVSFLDEMWNSSAYEVRTCWAEIEGHSAFRIIDAYANVVEMRPSLSQLEALARLYTDAGHLHQASHLWGLLCERFRQAGIASDLRRALDCHGRVLFELDELDKAMTLYQEAERICIALDDQQGLASSLGCQALIKQNRNDPEGAMALHKKEEQLFRESGDRAGLMTSLGNQALILAKQKAYDEAMKLHKQEEEICSELGDDDGLHVSLGNQALILKEQGLLAPAMLLLKRKEEICRRFGSKDGLQIALGNQALFLLSQDCLGEAEPILEERVKICRELGDKDTLRDALANLEEVLRTRGDGAKAHELMRERMRLLVEMGKTNELSVSFVMQEFRLRASGDLEGAQALLQEKKRVFRDLWAKGQLPSSRYPPPRQWSPRNREQSATDDLAQETLLTFFQEEVRLCREQGDSRRLQSALGRLALFTQGHGDPNDALAMMEERARICRDLGDPLLLKEALSGLAKVWRTRGDVKGSLELLKERELLQERARIALVLGKIDELLLEEAEVLRQRGDWSRILDLYGNSEPLFSQLDKEDQKKALLSAAHHLQSRGCMDLALPLFARAASICRELSDTQALQSALNGQADILLAQGHRLRAAWMRLRERTLAIRNAVSR
jgi:tetratricopeptide (TPR) repeat protein